MGDYALIDLFAEWFPGWVKDIESVEDAGPDTIKVTLGIGKQYLFGREDEHIFLKTVKEENK